MQPTGLTASDPNNPSSSVDVPEELVQSVIDNYKRQAATHNAQVDVIWKAMWDSVYDSRAKGFHAPDPPQQYYWVANEPLLRQIAGMIGGIPGVNPFIDIPVPAIPPPAIAHPSIVVTSEPSLIPGSFLATGDSPTVPEGAVAQDAAGKSYRKKVFLHTPWTTISGWIPI